MKAYNGQPEISIKKMELRHLPGVMEIERESFADPWSRQSFISEICRNNYAHYLVACYNKRVVGYIGAWNVANELHITNLAIEQEQRRKGIAVKLIGQMIEEARIKGALRVTLEVRISNRAAIKLYKKMGFRAAGKRPRYYLNNGEDALIMWKGLRNEKG
ncbi:MAG TPA: ribosomal protein S18-alanine N-acetyltransferase [Halanaerobiales bacterium]|nr:ribosomal protein S18-alanine N-acetyltransferase [Halanaerobiales bacterium]